MKHKHYDLIVAWAEGKDIQFRAYSDSDWEDVDMNGEEWYVHYIYRIKPKPDVVQTCEVSISFASFNSGYPTVQFTFDGETGKLKSAEVL